jgi:uncharacterized protein (DUF1330 family)
VVCYRCISDPTAREKYSKLGGPAVLAAGGRFLTRAIPAKTYEHGIQERTVVIEFESLAQAVAAHDSPAYQAALAALGNGAHPAAGRASDRGQPPPACCVGIQKMPN